MLFRAVAAMAAVLGLGAAASCEVVLGDLPPVREPPDGGGTGGAGSAASSGSAASAGSTGSVGSAGSGGGPCCDCDHDGYPSKALCGGDDCDDADPVVHPGQTMYFATPSKNPNVGFDYDCSGTPDPEFPSPLHCNAIMGGDCDAGVGFLNAVPPCGTTGPWGSCQPGTLPLTCAQHVIDPGKVSRCR